MMLAPRVHPFDLVARVLSERLQGRVASAPLRAMVASRRTEWERVVGLTSAQLVLPALGAALKDLELLGSLDQDLGAFLEAVHAANRDRNQELRAELAAAVGVLNRAGIEPVLLKGALRLVDGLYPDDGWRMLRDLDLLIPAASAANAARAFAQAGYAACGPGGEVRRGGGACQIDLHTELLGTPRQLRLLSAAEMLVAARPATFEGARVRVPTIEHQLVHLIAHGQLRHFGHAFGRVRLRNRLEAAALVRWGRERTDWQAVHRRFVMAGYRRPLLSFLLALSDGGWCTVVLNERTDHLTALQHRRIALQARSATADYIGARLGWWISAFASQLATPAGGKASGNLRRLICERGAIRRLSRGFVARGRHLIHALPHLGWLAS